MYIDALCARALARELTAGLVGARVQDLLQPDRLSVGLELYIGRRRYLVLSASPGHPGLLLGDGKVRRGGGAPSPLFLALSAHLEGARLARVTQPPWERALVLTFQAEAEWRLVAELQGRLANLILLAPDDRIVAAARTVTEAMSRARQTLPGRPYQPPPAPAKEPPDAVAPPQLAAWLGEAGEGPAWRVLVDRLLGVSPMAAREAAFRSAGEAEAPATRASPAALLASLAALLVEADAEGAGGWLALDGPLDDAAPVAYAPYEPTHYPDRLRLASLTEAMGRFAAASPLGAPDAYLAARAEVAALLAEARARAARQADGLRRGAADGADADRYRLWGDLLQAYQSQVAAGADQASLPGMDGVLSIPLDPALGAVENAQRYFDKARKAQRSAEGLPARLAEAEAVLATLDQWSADLALAESRPEIDAVHELLRASPHLGRPLRPRPSGRAAPSRPLERRSSAGLRILVGRNSRQNELVTFTLAARDDLWLHARGRPGAHVVVKAAGREVDEASLAEAAGLALWFSSARTESAAEVMVTEVRRVRRLPGGGAGMVTVTGERVVRAVPVSPDDLDG